MVCSEDIVIDELQSENMGTKGPGRRVGIRAVGLAGGAL